MSLHGPHPSRASLPIYPSPAIDSIYLAGESPAGRRVRSQLQRVAPHFRTALITGEAGTGKETVARALHERSPGADGPFIVWQAAKFAKSLVRKDEALSLLLQARRGTLFLREIGAISQVDQGHLLHVLNQHEIRSQRFDLRIVVANESELRVMTTTGQFRQDLYRDLAAVQIALTPLRKRPEDIPEIAAVLMHQLGTRVLTPEAATHLQQYAWPGNIAELKQVLEVGAILAEGASITPCHLALPSSGNKEHQNTLELLQDVVQRHVLEVLTRCAGNKLRASEMLGISRSTLYRMLDAYPTSIDADRAG